MNTTKEHVLTDSHQHNPHVDALKISMQNWLTHTLAWVQAPYETAYIKDILLQNDIPLDIQKSLLLPLCKELLTKNEYKDYESAKIDRSTHEFMQFIENKIVSQKWFDASEKDPSFKWFITTTLLAQKMCNEFWINSSNHPKYALLQQYIISVKPEWIAQENWITIEHDIFQQTKKQKKAQNPITFIDLTHQETDRNNSTHIKMWLYLLFARKDTKANSGFFTIDADNIETFTLTSAWYTLFSRLFNESCKLHREIINDPTQPPLWYEINSIDDIQQILLAKYHQPGSASLTPLEYSNFNSYIDITECLFHIWSHRLYGKGKWRQLKGANQLTTIVERSSEARDEIFDLTPFWEEIVTNFSANVEHFWLFIKWKSKTKLNKETFLKYINTTTMSWSIPVIDGEWNEFIFSWRCKELKSIVNKMLNTPKYSHIDFYNDILWTRIELTKPANKNLQNPENVMINLYKKIIPHIVKDPQFKYFNLKGIYHEQRDEIVNPEYKEKEKSTPSGSWWVVNTKTGTGYNEIKMIFTWYEIQLLISWNNTTGEKDDSIYAFKKIEDILLRIMWSISVDDLHINSMTNWVQRLLRKKRYNTLKDKITQVMANEQIVDYQIIEDLCTTLLVHEMIEEKQENDNVISTTMVYLLAKKHYLIKNQLESQTVAEFEKKYTDTNWSMVMTYQDLKKDTSIVWKEIAKIIDTMTDPRKMYILFQTIKEHSQCQIETTITELNAWDKSDIPSQLLVLHDQRILTQQKTIKEKIQLLYASISPNNYNETIDQLLNKLEENQRDKAQKIAQLLFRKTLLDRKNIEHNNRFRKNGKKLFENIGHLVVHQLQSVLQQSSMFSSLSPELFSLMVSYWTVVDMKHTNPKELYTQWKKDFDQNKQSQHAAYYEFIYDGIKTSWFYTQYKKLIEAYLRTYIINDIGKRTDRAEMNTVSWVYTTKKINPAKTAWLNKMRKQRTNNSWEAQ